MRRLVLIALLGRGVAACQPGDGVTSPEPDAEQSGAPLYDQGAEPEETQPETEP
jgi:hypothetical protein